MVVSCGPDSSGSGSNKKDNKEGGEDENTMEE
jgi:hypothetical protein